MKISVLLATTVVAFASMASAAPLCTDVGPTMDYYLALTGGCQIGDKLFSDFSYQGTAENPSAAVPPTAVFVTPDNTDPYNPGIIFSSASWLTSSTGVDSSIGFTVTVLPGGNFIEDAGMTLLSSGATGLGSGSITETILNLGAQLTVDTGTGGVGGQRAAHVSFAPSQSVSVLKDVLVTVQRGQGSAQISSFEENFSEIPEPVGSALIGSGLLALGFWRHRASCA